MSTPTVMLLSVSAGMHFGGFGLLLCFVGFLVPVVFGSPGALAEFVRRNAAAVGLVMASCAFTAVSGDEDPVLCFGMFALLLLGLTLVNIGAHGHW